MQKQEMATAMRVRGVKEKETRKTRQMGVGRVNLSLTMRMQIELGRAKETWTGVSSWLYCQKPRGHLLPSICLWMASSWPRQPSVQKAFQRCANRTLAFDMVCMRQPHSTARNSVDPQLVSGAAVLRLLYSGESVMMCIVLLPCCFVSAEW